MALETKANMSKQVLFEFFDTCNLKFQQSDEVQQALAHEILENRGFPSKTVNETRHAVLESLGFEREHGMASFKKLGEELKNDPEFGTAYHKWHQICTDVCLALLRASQRSGVEITGEPGMLMQLLRMRAKEEVIGLSPEDQAMLLQKNAEAAQSAMSLSPEKRTQLLDSLSEAQALELFKSEMMLEVVLKLQERSKLAERAQEELKGMSPEDQATLLQKNGETAQTAMSLSPEKRELLLNSMSEAQTLELLKSEILLEVVLKHQGKKANDKTCTPYEGSLV